MCSKVNTVLEGLSDHLTPKEPHHFLRNLCIDVDYSIVSPWEFFTNANLAVVFVHDYI